jgi:hypothetical protein
VTEEACNNLSTLSLTPASVNAIRATRSAQPE